MIGNPPWVDIKGHEAKFVKYYFKSYNTTENRINLYSIFVEKSLYNLNKAGIFSFIMPNSILTQSSYMKIRKYILNNFFIKQIIRLPDNVFINVNAETCILVIQKTKPQKTSVIIYNQNDNINYISTQNSQKFFNIDQSSWFHNEYHILNIFTDKKTNDLINKIEQNTKPLEIFCDF